MSFEFLRGVLGVLCVLFAFMAGRSVVPVRRGTSKPSKLYGWIVRAAACAFALSLRHPIDGIDIGVWSFTALAFGAGWWAASHEKPQEDLSHEIFPE